MPQILPIRGLRYAAAAGPLSELLSPPYDVITPAQQRALAQRNPYNAVHLELAAGGPERYEAVAALVRRWQDDGALHRDEEPTLYVYEQRFEEAGHAYARRALIAGVEARPWEDGAVKPHEFTMSGPKEDRLRLLEVTRIQFSPIFMIARDRAGQLRQFLDSTIASRDPDSTATSLEGDDHRLWVVEASSYEMRQLAPLLSESFYIADGHHRYETAVTYQQRLSEREGRLSRDHPARFALTAIVPAADPGLVIRPIHRVVARPAPIDWQPLLEASFAVATMSSDSAFDVERLEEALASAAGAIVALNLAPGAAHLLRPLEAPGFVNRIPPGHSDRWAGIAPNVLRYGVLEPLWGITDDDLRAGAVDYTHDAGEVIERVQRGAAGFLLNPVDINEVMTLADQGERMPQKSTFFHPKLGTGLVFHPLYP